MATIQYQSETCDRCCGTGKMPYAAYNGVCFGCNGTGMKLTRAGKKAKAAISARKAELCNVPVTALEPGMVIVSTDATGKTRSSVKRATVVSVAQELETGWTGGHHFDIQFRGLAYGNVNPDAVFVRQPTAAEFAELVALAATLPGATVVE